MASEEISADQRLSESDDVKKESRGSQEVPKRFRLLIIGKSGCGKTTILSKVCGKEVADKPSTTRGIHNIEKEMSFKGNSLFVVHDSEGFEAGKEEEYRVVKKFIQSRSRAEDINDRLHAIWYCLTTSSRSIQQAEKMFFSEKHDIPIVAVFTKFDLFIEGELQDLMESEENLDEEKEIELEKEAESIAVVKFDKHFKRPLLNKPFPPKSVVRLSDVQSSTPHYSRLGDLMRATTFALEMQTTGDDIKNQSHNYRLAELFATAQQADMSQKYRYSMRQGVPYILPENEARYEAGIWRPDITVLWSRRWQMDETLLSEFERHVDQHPRTMGNSDFPRERNGKQLSNAEIEAYRCLQLAADLTAIMAQIFLRTIEDEESMKDIVRKYTTTSAFPYIQENILKTIDVLDVRVFPKDRFKLFSRHIRFQCATIIDDAVRSLMEL